MHTIQCNIPQHSTIQYSTVQYSTVQYIWSKMIIDIAEGIEADNTYHVIGEKIKVPVVWCPTHCTRMFTSFYLKYNFDDLYFTSISRFVYSWPHWFIRADSVWHTEDSSRCSRPTHTLPLHCEIPESDPRSNEVSTYVHYSLLYVFSLLIHLLKVSETWQLRIL